MNTRNRTDPALDELREAIAEFALTARRAQRATARAQAVANRLEKSDPTTLTEHDYLEAFGALTDANEAVGYYAPSMGRLVHARRWAARAGIWSDPYYDADRDEQRERELLAELGHDPAEASHIGPIH